MVIDKFLTAEKALSLMELDARQAFRTVGYLVSEDLRAKLDRLYRETNEARRQLVQEAAEKVSVA